MRQLLFAMLIFLAQSAAATVTDFLGRSVILDAPATRIVALSPHIVENLYSAGAGSKLVGVVSYSNYPVEAAKIAQVGSYAAFSLETIVSLKPDLIVMWGSGNGMAALEKLEPLGIPIFVSEPRVLADIPLSIRLLGKLAGTQNTSEAEALRIESEIEQLKTDFGGGREVSVLYQIWNDPLQTLNGNHLISQVIALCGGKNIFWDTKSLAPKISIESVLLRNPDVIVASGMSKARPEWLDDWHNYPSLQAVKNGALFYVDPDHIQRPTARVLLGARNLCEMLQSQR